MTISNFKKIVVIGIAISLLSGFGLGNLAKDVIPDTGKCGTSKKCKNEELIKGAIVLGLAAKLIYDAVISISSTVTEEEKKTLAKYKKKHGYLPKVSTVGSYKATLSPTKAKGGSDINIKTVMVYYRSDTKKDVKIEEKLTVYGKEKNAKAIKTASKVLNAKTKGGGEFTTKYKIPLPKKFPQGYYPIKTVILVDGKEVKSATKKKMQVVLRVNGPNDYEIIALHQ